MPVSLVDFWKRLITSGLADPATPRLWAAQYAQDHQGTPPSDPLKLAKWCIATKRLLPFQASSLIHGSPDIVGSDDPKNSVRFPKMRIAPLTQSGETPPEPFPHWLAVTRDAGQPGATGPSSEPIPGLVLQIVPSRLNAQDGDRLRSLAAQSVPGLPAFEMMGLAGGPLGHRKVSIPIGESVDTIGLFAPLPRGPVLADSLKKTSKWPIERIVELIRRLAPVAWEFAKQPGRVFPVASADRIWIGNPDQPLVWIDPVDLLSQGVFDFPHSIRVTESRFLYTPPERLADDVAGDVDQRSVLYSLGCLAYRLRTGSHAFAAAKEDQIRSRQLHFDPPELASAVAQGAAGDPMFRVLAYTMAKDPSQRFATIDQFIAALSATAPPPAPVSTPAPEKLKPELKPKLKPEPARNPEPNPKPEPKADLKPKAEPKPKPAPKPAPASVPVPATPSEPTAPVATKPSPVPVAVTMPPDEGTPATDRVTAPTPSHQTAAKTAEPATPSESSPWIEPAPRRRSGRRRTTWYVLHSLWIPIFLLIVANALHDPNAPRPVAKRIRPPIPAVIPSVTGSPTPRHATPRPATPRSSVPPTPPKAATTTDAASDSIEVFQDDSMLWAPPSALADAATTDPNRLPPTILLPPGPAAIVTIDYPNLVATGLRDTFDPEIAPLLDALQKRIVVPLDSVRLIAMAWFPGTDGIPEVALAVHLKEPRPLEELTEAWKVSQARGKDGVTLFASEEPDGFAYYPNAVDEEAGGERQVTAFAVGTIDQITEVAEVEGSRVLLPRQLEELWNHAEPSDAIALMTQPNFLVADARGWVSGLAPPLLDWIRGALIPECGGILLRVALSKDQATYVEARLSTAPGLNPVALRTKIAERLDGAPTSADDFLVTREIDPSWRLLASRLPTMWAFADDQTRSMIFERDVIFNTYLPPMALPQITLATLLASNTTATSAAATGPAPTEKLTIEQMLNRPMSISFGQESLQFAVDTIISEFSQELPEGNKMPPVEIIGGDLQLMGITQNQQVRNFSKTDVPLRTVLTDLVLGANPDKTATGPADPKQALVWVVVGQGDETKILVTTREASKGKYELPKEFVTSP
ncbi:serine/threonine-protein kinase [Neorhodopirellula pilleata]|uniref:Uncharacterized protein n=1 Tax=Neorhodopirellula pilleata TaxID=2714738 RepID=A0A5C6A983_9BACT|nr:serine/threonine protein kinase [Neorhodopirellula pilleata]TWT94893.1 hypothetical protein Pla100_34640 [Neorhodopirellula pilleata]